MYYVYVLLMNNKKLYKGFSGNLKIRLNDHKKGLAKSTKDNGPLKLIHYEVYSLKSDAQRRERFLKTTEGRRLLRQQIRDVLIKEKVI